MSEDSRRILRMVAEGKISVDEGERLLAALGDTGSDTGGPAPKYLKIQANSSGSGKDDSFRLRVPLSLIRAGMKMRGLVPEKARNEVNEKLREKGIEIDLFEMSERDIDGMIRMLAEVEVDAESGGGDRFSVRLE